MIKHHKMFISIGIILATSLYYINKRLTSISQQRSNSIITYKGLNLKNMAKETETIASQQKRVDIVERFQKVEVGYPPVDLQFCASCSGSSHSLSHSMKQV